MNAPTYSKLKAAGLATLLEIAATSDKELIALGLTGVRVRKIRRELDDNTVRGFECAYDLLQRRRKKSRLSTLLPSFDAELRGGLETQCIAEFYGGWGAGKTQMMHQLAIK